MSNQFRHDVEVLLLCYIDDENIPTTIGVVFRLQVDEICPFVNLRERASQFAGNWKCWPRLRKSSSNSKYLEFEMLAQVQAACLGELKVCHSVERFTAYYAPAFKLTVMNSERR